MGDVSKGGQPTKEQTTAEEAWFKSEMGSNKKWV